MKTWICPVCGYEMETETKPSICPLCGYNEMIVEKGAAAASKKDEHRRGKKD